MRVLAVISYRGTNYQGWQKQINANSVQEEVEKVLSKIFNRQVNTQGSGRTDAGVHAKAQTFHFDIDNKETDLDRLRYSINCLLPRDIYITSIKKVPDDFHARFSAKGKKYLYRIRLAERNIFEDDLIYELPMPFDIEAFKDAISLFIGTHDFRDFCSKPDDEEQFIRTIYSIDTSLNEVNKELDIVFRGDGFMRYQIRFMVGAAVSVAIGKIKKDFIIYHLSEGRKRETINLKAPAKGLYLLEVEY